MKFMRRLRRKPAVLVFYSGSVFALGGCLPENYLGDLFVRLTTSAADVAVQTLVGVALDTVLPADAGTVDQASQ